LISLNVFPYSASIFDQILNKISVANIHKTADVVFPVPDHPIHIMFPSVEIKLISSSLSLSLKLGIFCKNCINQAQASAVVHC